MIGFIGGMLVGSGATYLLSPKVNKAVKETLSDLRYIAETDEEIKRRCVKQLYEWYVSGELDARIAQLQSGRTVDISDSVLATAN